MAERLNICWRRRISSICSPQFVARRRGRGRGRGRTGLDIVSTSAEQKKGKRNWRTTNTSTRGEKRFDRLRRDFPPVDGQRERRDIAVARCNRKTIALCADTDPPTSAWGVVQRVIDLASLLLSSGGGGGGLRVFSTVHSSTCRRPMVLKSLLRQFVFTVGREEICLVDRSLLRDSICSR